MTKPFVWSVDMGFGVNQKALGKTKCKTCFGYGLWASGNPSPMGKLDGEDGMPTIECPECKANKNPKKVIENA